VLIPSYVDNNNNNRCRIPPAGEFGGYRILYKRPSEQGSPEGDPSGGVLGVSPITNKKSPMIGG
jgi:hypothetical protein